MVNSHEITRHQVHFALAMLHARHVQANAEFIGHNVLTSPAQGVTKGDTHHGPWPMQYSENTYGKAMGFLGILMIFRPIIGR